MAALGQALASALLMNISIVGTNQLFDIEIDRVNKPDLPLASGELSVTEGNAIVVLSTLASLALGWASGSQPLMVTLVDVELFGQGVLGKDQTGAAFLLLHFLAALPIGALAGGWLATRVGDRPLAVVGMLVAAFAYWLVSKWGVDVLSARHEIGPVSLPTFGTDLALAGIGLGLVIGPLTSAALRVVPAAQHGIASALVVVARMTGMLIGVAALTAWGLYRFNQILATLPSVQADNLAAKVAGEAERYRTAFAMQYGSIFFITMIVCLAGAGIALFIGARGTRAIDEGGEAGPSEVNWRKPSPGSHTGR